MIPDLECLDDLNPMAAEVTELGALRQDNYHTLIEGSGTNVDAPERGLGMLSRLSGAIDQAFERVVEADLLRDSRNASVQATLSQAGDDTYELSIEYVPFGDEVEATTIELSK